MIPIAQSVYRTDRSYAWNYGHAPKLPRVRRLPAAPGGKLFDYPLNSQLGVASGPLLNAKWIEAYARVGYDVLTYATVRSGEVPALGLPNIRTVENREQAAVATTRRGGPGGDLTLAVSLGTPSMTPDVWRKDIQRARERLGKGQVLIVSVLGTTPPGGDREMLVTDYARCAQWAAEAGAHVVEVQLAWPDPCADQPQAIFENLPLAAQVLHRVRTSVDVPVIAKLGAFRTPRLLHDTVTRLASWASGFVLVHGFQRRVIDEAGNTAFEGRDRADIVGADTFPAASRQVAELLAWRKAGCWDRAVLAVGGLTTVERAHDTLREGADVALIATAALYDPLFAVRFRQHRATAVA